jgi:[CysO sulfur-carrier protein]-S-L-cysteine hydrolase
VGIARTGGAVIEIPAQIHADLVAHAFSEVPNEACGLLAGSNGRVERFYPVRNADKSPTTYSFDDREHQDALDELDRHGWEVVGVFHSHTHTRAYPSKTDLEKSIGPRRFYPNARFFILSLANRSQPDLRAFVIDDDRVDEQEVRVL